MKNKLIQINSCKSQNQFKEYVKQQGTILLAIILYAIAVSCEQLQIPKNRVPQIVHNKVKRQISTNAIANTLATTNSTDKTSKVYVRNDGTVVVNNRPFFLFGIYHGSQSTHDWTTTGEKRLNDLKEVAAAGFNTIHPEVGGSYKSDITFFREAQRLNVFVLPNFSYEHRIEIINKYKSEPAILGWDIADDVDHPDNSFTPQIIQEWHKSSKKADPNHITYISGAFPRKIARFLTSANIVGFQSYPIDNDPNDKKPLRNNYYTILSAHQNEQGSPYNRPIIANLQLFPWKNRPPTFHEVRNMTYSALINGVKGILYYSFCFDGWELSEQKDLWSGMKTLAPEITRLSPILLEGKLTKINTKVDDLFAGQWEYKNNIYIVVLSTSPTEQIQASLTLPAEKTGEAKPLFPGRPSGMSFHNDKLRGWIQPGDVHVYLITKLS